MLKNSLKIIWRKLRRDSQFSFLNLIGLSSGLACAILILLWVNDEERVGKFNRKDSQLYQVMVNTETPHGVETGENTPGLLAATLARELPEVEYTVPVIPVSWFDRKGILSYGGNHIEASEQFVGRDYFNVFTYPLLHGEIKTILADKHFVLISDDLANKLFHTTENIIGKTVDWNQQDYSGVYQISGIFQKSPQNATERFDILFNYELFLDKNPKMTDWRNNDPATYLILKKGVDVSAFNNKIKDFIKTRDDKSKRSLFIQKYSDRYLYGRYENGTVSGGRIEYVRLFSIIAVFILIIACVNFMNLSTAKATGRLKETGIKKVMGARRVSLVFQFLGESTMMSFLALITAVLWVFLLLPKFNEITGKHLIIPFDLKIILIIIGITLVTGIIAGSYPAFYLSRFNPSETLRGRLKNSVSELLVRKGLVIFQFALSGIFIISVLVIYRQMRLIQTRNLGYNREHVIYFDKGGILSEKKEDYAEGGKYQTNLKNFIERIRAIPGVVNASNFRHSIVDRNGGTSDISWPGKDPQAKMDITDLGVGYDFIETMGIVMKEGRTYNQAFGAEKSKIIFNELAIERMGLKNPIGKKIHLWGEDREIIGVAKNFNFQSLYENLKPCFFDLTFNQRASKILVRIQAGQETKVIDNIEKLYKEDNQGLSFEYKFLDEDYQSLYASEKRVATLAKYFAGLAIIISCLGLFGLAAFTAQKRQKEIGIRKVIGASVNNIIVMLSTNFIKMVLVALLIAFPLSWWAMSRWLHDFAYHIDIGVAVFLIAGAATILITLLTISFQAIKAATANPVRSLRSE